MQKINKQSQFEHKIELDDLSIECEENTLDLERQKLIDSLNKQIIINKYKDHDFTWYKGINWLTRLSQFDLFRIIFKFIKLIKEQVNFHNFSNINQYFLE